MPQATFINLPVRDLDRSIAFFTALGFSFDENMTDERATAMIITDQSYAMLLTEPFFKTFTDKEIADAGKTTEVITALSVESREKVDELIGQARSAGAPHVGEPAENGPMYGGSFADPDGHLWEVFHFPMG
ncbi:VOC family protein [Saccharopolyspora griseoalba]|uniref:VOC family protein n=1 Tax=Saccharopolyspora griseoalba TaxID=1431848 RepID=A0ABW2LQZ9_9PSEU